MDVHLPMTLRLEPLPNTPQKQAVLYGPLLLVGAMGHEGMEPNADMNTDQAPHNNQPALPVPVLVGGLAEVTRSIRRVPGRTLTFQTTDAGKEPITLVPTHLAHHQRLNTYWSVYSPEEWAQRKAELARDEAAQRALDARTVDKFLPGNQQSEVDHQLKSEKSNAGEFNGASWRDTYDGGWFEFVLKAADGPLTLVCTYWGSDSGGRSFDILADGTQIATQTLENNQPGQLFDVPYPIPPTLTAGKSRVTVRLQAKPGMAAGGLFACRLLRSQTDAAV